MKINFKPILLIYIILNLSACGNRNAEQTQESTSQTIIAQENKAKIDYTDAISGATNTTERPSFNGIIDVDPRAKATISMTMGGIVRKLNAVSGEYLRKGDVIAIIDNLEYVTLQQEYLDTSVQLEFLEEEYNRQLALSEQDAVSKKSMQQTKADYLSLKSRCNSLKTKLEILGTNLESLKDGNIDAYMTIKAPISGYIADFNANIGKYMDVGEPLCTLIDKSNPRIVMTVYEKDLSYISKGLKIYFKVNTIGDKEFEAIIDAVDQVVNPNDYSIKVYATIKDYQDEFRPGMYVRARLAD